MGCYCPNNPLDDHDTVTSEASGEGESLISASDYEPPEEFDFREYFVQFSYLNRSEAVWIANVDKFC